MHTKVAEALVFGIFVAILSHSIYEVQTCMTRVEFSDLWSYLYSHSLLSDPEPPSEFDQLKDQTKRLDELSDAKSDGASEAQNILKEENDDSTRSKRFSRSTIEISEINDEESDPVDRYERRILNASESANMTLKELNAGYFQAKFKFEHPPSTTPGSKDPNGTDSSTGPKSGNSTPAPENKVDNPPKNGTATPPDAAATTTTITTVAPPAAPPAATIAPVAEKPAATTVAPPAPAKK